MDKVNRSRRIHFLMQYVPEILAPEVGIYFGEPLHACLLEFLFPDTAQPQNFLHIVQERHHVICR